MSDNTKNTEELARINAVGVSDELQEQAAGLLVGSGELEMVRDAMVEACESGRHWGAVYKEDNPEAKKYCKRCGAEITPEVEVLRQQTRKEEVRQRSEKMKRLVERFS